MRRVVSMLSGFITLNRSTFDEISLEYPALSGKARLESRHPVYCLPEAPSQISSNALSDFLKTVESDRQLIVAWGKLAPYKQLHKLAEAALDLDDRFVTLIIGRCEDPELQARLTELSETSSGRLKLITGHISDGDLAHLLQRSCAAVFSFRQITNSGSVIATLSAGTPVIAPSLPGLVELRDDIGADWVRLFDGELRTETLDALATYGPPSSPPITKIPKYQGSVVANDIHSFLTRTFQSKP